MTNSNPNSGRIGPNGEGLIFVLGPPRSGTTLLSTMLMRHPAAIAPPESWIMLALSELGHAPAPHPCDSRVLGSAIVDFQRYCATPEAEPPLIRAARAAATTLYEQALEKYNARYFIDKTPRYYLILDFITNVFPKSKYVVLFRNPLDVAASRLSTWRQDISHIIKNKQDDPAIFDMVLSYPILTKFITRTDLYIKYISYENLVFNSHHNIKQVFDFLGFDTQDMLIDSALDLNQVEWFDTFLGDKKIKGTTAPHRQSVGSWRHILNPHQQSLILDAVGSDMMAFLGYQRDLDYLRASGIAQSDSATVDAYRRLAADMLLRRQQEIARTTTFVVGT